MNANIFRKVSLERLSSPERLDQAYRVTAPKEILTLLGILFLLSVTVVWAFRGSLPTKVTAQGVVIRRGGVVNIVASGAGQIVKLNVRIGDIVQPNQVVAEIAEPSLNEKIRVAEAALADARRERERSFRVRTDTARLQLDALARQKENAEREIADLGRQIRIVDEQIPVDDQLLARGLITKQASLQTRQKKVMLEGQIGSLQAQLKQIESQRFTAENQPKESDVDMVARITDLERNVSSLRKDLATTANVVSPYGGQVLETKVYRGSAVVEGTPIISIQPDAGKLEALVYVSSIQSHDVKPGMEAQISPGTVRREEYGYMTGKVTFVAAYPATHSAMMSTLENDSLVTAMTTSGPVTEIRLELDPGDTPSGFHWSSRKGPPQEITGGTLCSAQIVTLHETPISLVIPAVRQRLGID